MDSTCSTYIGEILFESRANCLKYIPSRLIGWNTPCGIMEVIKFYSMYRIKLTACLLFTSFVHKPTKDSRRFFTISARWDGSETQGKAGGNPGESFPYEPSAPFKRRPQWHSAKNCSVREEEVLHCVQCPGRWTMQSARHLFVPCGVRKSLVQKAWLDEGSSGRHVWTRLLVTSALHIVIETTSIKSS